MSRMHNPAHPGAVLREYLGDMSVTDAATALGITRTALSRILNEKAGISADMALRLESALGTSAEMWTGMQSQYELWVASQTARPIISPGLTCIPPHWTGTCHRGDRSPRSVPEPALCSCCLYAGCRPASNQITAGLITRRVESVLLTSSTGKIWAFSVAFAFSVSFRSTEERGFMRVSACKAALCCFIWHRSKTAETRRKPVEETKYSPVTPCPAKR